MKKINVLLIVMFSVVLVSCGGKSSEKKTTNITVKKVPAEIKKEAVDICAYCNKEYPKGQGYFKFKQFTQWHLYEQKNDVYGAGIGKYCCSPECAGRIF